jgi:hypothetical protein
VLPAGWGMGAPPLDPSTICCIQGVPHQLATTAASPHFGPAGTSTTVAEGQRAWHMCCTMRLKGSNTERGEATGAKAAAACARDRGRRRKSGVKSVAAVATKSMSKRRIWMYAIRRHTLQEPKLVCGHQAKSRRCLRFHDPCRSRLSNQNAYLEVKKLTHKRSAVYLS